MLVSIYKYIVVYTKYFELKETDREITAIGVSNVVGKHHYGRADHPTRSERDNSAASLSISEPL